MWRRKLLLFLGHRDHVSVLRASSTGLNDLLLSQESETERKEGSKKVKYKNKIKKMEKVVKYISIQLHL